MTNTILRVPYYGYSIMGNKTLFQFFKAPIVFMVLVIVAAVGRVRDVW